MGLYFDLKKAQPTPYTALLDLGKNKFLSFSPELFFRINKNTIVTRPMKGTAKRGLIPGEDKKLRQELTKDLKTKAENIMIVDLLY